MDRGGRGNRGKSVATQQEPAAAAENPPFKDFTLMLGNMKGTYGIMMKQIEATVKEMLQDEISRQPADERMPPTVRGRPYTPATGSGMFLVKIIPDESQGGGKVVSLLIRWCDFYILAFHVEAVWYHYNDFTTNNMLPPQSQLPYNCQAGMGIIRLPISSSYAQIGGYKIKVGKPSFTHCFRTLGKLGELYRTQQGLKLLKSGPLSLPTIAISEAIRFGLWREWVISHMDEEADTDVPTEHNSLFNHWSDISDAIASNSSWRGREVDELVKIVCVLMRSDRIKPNTAKSESSSSRSRKK